MWKNWNPFRRKHKEEDNLLNGDYGKENTRDEMSTIPTNTQTTESAIHVSDNEIDHHQLRNRSTHFQQNEFVSHQINGVNGRTSVSFNSQDENKLHHSNNRHPQSPLRLSLKSQTVARLHDNLNRSLPISDDRLLFNKNVNRSIREEHTNNSNIDQMVKIKEDNRSFSGVHGPLLSSPIVPKVRRALESSVQLRSPRTTGLQNGKPVGRSMSLNYGSQNPAKSTAGQIPWVRLKRRESIGLTELASGNIPQSPNTVKLAAPEHRHLPAAPSFKSTPLIVTTEASRNCVVDTQTVVSALREKRKRFGTTQQEGSVCEDTWNSSAKRRRQDSSQSNASSVSMPPMPDSLPNLMGTPGTSLLHIENLADQRPSTVPAIDAFISHHHRVMGLGGERSPQQPQQFYHKQHQKNNESSSKSVLRSIQSSLSSSLRAKTNLSMLQQTGIDVKRLRALSQSKEANRKMSVDSDMSALGTDESLAEPNSKITREDTLPVVTTGLSSLSTPAAASVTTIADILLTSTPVMTPVSRKIAEGVVLRKHSLSTNPSPSPVRPLKAVHTNILATSSDFERDRQREYKRRVVDLLNGDENSEGAVTKTSSEFTMISASPSSTLVASSSQSMLPVATSAAVSASLDSLKLIQSAAAPSMSTTAVSASNAVNSLSQLLKQDEGVATSAAAVTSTTTGVSLPAQLLLGNSSAPSTTSSSTSTASGGFNFSAGVPAAAESSGFQINFGNVASSSGSTPSTDTTGVKDKSGFSLDLASRTTSSSAGSNPSISSAHSSGDGFGSVTAPSAATTRSIFAPTTSLSSGPMPGLNPNPSTQANQGFNFTSSLPISKTESASSTPSFNISKDEAGVNKSSGFTFGSGAVQSTSSATSLTSAGLQSGFSLSGGFSFGGVNKTTQAGNGGFTLGSGETPSFTVSTASFPGQPTQSSGVVINRLTALDTTAAPSGPTAQPSLSFAATTLPAASTAASLTMFNTGVGSFGTGQQPSTGNAPSFSILNSGSTTDATPNKFVSTTTVPSTGTFNFGQASSQAPSSTTFSFGQTTAAANSTPFNYGQTSTAASSAPFSFGQPSTNSGQTASTAAPFTFGQSATASSMPSGFSQTSTASSANPTPFNFGQTAASTNSTFTFGAPKTQAIAGSIFGSSSNAGAVTTSAMFGSTTTVTMASSSIFGTGAAPVFKTSSTFGNTATGFGSNSAPSFNSQGATSAFGFSTPTTAPPAFGSASSNLNGSGFGGSASQTNKPFTFGANVAPTNTTQSSIFGTNSTQPPPFSSSTTQPSPFGTTTNNQPPSFGTTTNQPPPFGSITTQPPPFGTSTNQPPPFGTNANQPPPFGTSTTQPPPFGTSTTQQPPFGSSTTQPPPFGTSTNQPSPFGTSTTQPPPFGSASNQLSAFGSNTVFGAPTIQTPSMFGSKSSSVFGATSGPVFGASTNVATTTAAPTFGSFTASGFGTPSVSQQNPAFGATSQSFNPSAVATFGTPQKSLFGSTSASSFGTQVSQSTANPTPFGGATASTAGSGGFGATNTSLFGAATTQSAFNFSGAQTQQSNAFGSQPTNSTSSGFNFNQPTTQPASGGVFNFSAQTSARPSFAAPSPGGFNFAATTPNPGAFNFSAAPTTQNMFTPQTPGSAPRPRAAMRRPGRASRGPKR
ncbi:unnamed protein product [Lymnaea stagnalis]|uniref:Uncharacterized protein n=1 Tax=Lymnaea stagnalis TaxID=6523 RepID=A0AAV2HBJ5_LYMST